MPQLNEISGYAFLGIVQWFIVLGLDLTFEWWAEGRITHQPGFGSLQIIVALLCIVNICWSIFLWNEWKGLPEYD